MTDLRERFEALRDEERAAVPPFAVPKRRPARTPLRVLLVPASLLLIVSISALLFPRPRPVSFTVADERTARSITEWHAPTDFLLRTPGNELLSSMPSIPSKGISR